jgi:hypothetical protein
MSRDPNACECDRCNRPYRHFVQLDGWSNRPYDGYPAHLMTPDDDGDVVNQIVVLEPQNSDTTVRLWVRWDADKEDVRRLLAKAQETYGRCSPAAIVDAMPF